MEDLIPEEYFVDPASFESVFLHKTAYASLRRLASEGGIARIKNRFISWRVFLGIFCEEASVESWVETARSYREEYSRLCQSFAVTAT
jgi:hypothetical protein